MNGGYWPDWRTPRPVNAGRAAADLERRMARIDDGAVVAIIGGTIKPPVPASGGKQRVHLGNKGVVG